MSNEKTEEELMREHREARRAERRERKRSKSRKINKVAEDYYKAEDLITGTKKKITKADLADPLNKDTPFAIGYTKKGKPSRNIGLTERLKEVISVPAQYVEDTLEYCKLSGLDPSVATVRDCIVHNLIHWTLKGSSPHMKELLERVDGKIPQKVEASIGAKMSITDAMSMINIDDEDEILDVEMEDDVYSVGDEDE